MSEDRLSAADLSWIKLRRHDQECVECAELRRKEYRGQAAAQRLAFTVPPTPSDQLVCNQRKILLSQHLENMKAEKGSKL